MPYPLVIAPNGQEIMRINLDASISVLWDKVLHHRYESPTPLNVAVIKCCELLWAAKDNFVPMSWEDSAKLADQWDHFSTYVDYLESPLVSARYQFTVYTARMFLPELIARVNMDGSWSVQWPQVEEVALWTSWTAPNVALVGFCRLLIAAKHRFLTAPWIEQEQDD